MATIPYNPLGLVHIRIDAPDEAWVIENARQSKLFTSCTLDAMALARRLHDEGGVHYSVARFYSFEPDPGEGASREQVKEYARGVYQQIKNLIAQGGSRNVHVQVNCEQGMHDNRLRMYCDLIDLAVSDPDGPVGMVFSNMASGAYAHGFWVEGHDGFEYVHDANFWARPAALEYLKKLDEHRNVRVPSGAYAFLHGDHGYTAYYPSIAVNGGERKGDPAGWLFAMEVNWHKPQDHLLRGYQAMRNALGWEPRGSTWTAGAKTLRRADGTPVEPPWIVETEELIDAMNDVTAVHPEQKPGGYNRLREIWGRWYPGRAAGEVLAKMRLWKWQVLARDTGYYVGMHNFCLGDPVGWSPHTLNPAFALDTAYFVEIKRLGETLRVQAHFIRSEGVEKIIDTPGAFVNLRAKAATSGAVLIAVPDLARVEMHDETSGGWRKITYQAQTGWVSEQGGAVKFLDIPAPPEPGDVEARLAALEDGLKRANEKIVIELGSMNARLAEVEARVQQVADGSVSTAMLASELADAEARAREMFVGVIQVRHILTGALEKLED